MISDTHHQQIRCLLTLGEVVNGQKKTADHPSNEVRLISRDLWLSQLLKRVRERVTRMIGKDLILKA